MQRERFLVTHCTIFVLAFWCCIVVSAESFQHFDTRSEGCADANDLLHGLARLGIGVALPVATLLARAMSSSSSLYNNSSAASTTHSHNSSSAGTYYFRACDLAAFCRAPPLQAVSDISSR
jgi:hypothetical protein